MDTTTTAGIVINGAERTAIVEDAAAERAKYDADAAREWAAHRAEIRAGSADTHPDDADRVVSHPEGTDHV